VERIRFLLMERLDPLSLRPVRKPFVLLRHGAQHVYDADTLYEYILASGDVRDPITRGDYAGHELLRLQRQCGRPLPSRALLVTCAEMERERRAVVFSIADEILEQARAGILAVDALDDLRSIAEGAEWRALRELLAVHGMRP